MHIIRLQPQEHPITMLGLYRMGGRPVNRRPGGGTKALDACFWKEALTYGPEGSKKGGMSAVQFRMCLCSSARVSPGACDRAIGTRTL